MSKQTPDKSPSEEERESDEEEEDKYAPLHLSPSTELHEYSYHESLDPGPGHASLSRLDMPLSTGGLRTRGPGRPRIHVCGGWWLFWIIWLLSSAKCFRNDNSFEFFAFSNTL